MNRSACAILQYPVSLVASQALFQPPHSSATNGIVNNEKKRFLYINWVGTGQEYNRTRMLSGDNHRMPNKVTQTAMIRVRLSASILKCMICGYLFFCNCLE